MKSVVKNRVPLNGHIGQIQIRFNRPRITINLEAPAKKTIKLLPDVSRIPLNSLFIFP
jgi:hypothetical protein